MQLDPHRIAFLLQYRMIPITFSVSRAIVVELAKSIDFHFLKNSPMQSLNNFEHLISIISITRSWTEKEIVTAKVSLLITSTRVA